MILFATQNFLPSIGGTQLYVTGLADALAAQGHAIEVFCDSASRDAAARVDRARAYPIRRFGGLRPWMRRAKARAVAKRIAEGGVQAIITDTWKSLEHLPEAPLRGVRVLCLAHGSEFLVPAGSSKERRMIECLSKVDIVAANSHFTADLARPFVRGKTDMRVLLPGVDAPAGASAQYVASSRREQRLLTIARLEPRKGIDTVLRILPALARSHPGIRYDIIGKGDDLDRLIALAKSLGVSQRVHFHGYISEQDKADLLANAAVFLMPNRREPESVEGFGIVFIEAAAFGIPSIAGADGGTVDAVRNGETGYVVNGEDGNAVAAAVANLLNDPAARIRIGKAAHHRFWSEFVWSEAVHRFEQVLDLG